MSPGSAPPNGSHSGRTRMRERQVFQKCRAVVAPAGVRRHSVRTWARTSVLVEGEPPMSDDSPAIWAGLDESDGSAGVSLNAGD